jgi:diaminopimelate epimerase
VHTGAGVLTAEAKGANGRVEAVRVSMGKPRFEPSAIPVATEAEPPVKDLPLLVGNYGLRLTCVSMGNPHAVHFLDHPVAEFSLSEIGPKVEHHPLFPQRVNFEVARVLDRASMELRVWERGVGPTLACGTGACATMVAAHIHGYVDDTVDITLPGGQLRIEWDGVGEVYLTGSVERVFTGEWSK